MINHGIPVDLGVALFVLLGGLTAQDAPPEPGADEVVVVRVDGMMKSKSGAT